MRDDLLRNLASRAASNPEFLRQARRDLRGTIARHGYRLTNEETRLVEDFLRKTAAMTDVQLAGTLASGLEERTGSPPARPSAPSWRDSDPTRPARPGG
jgi:hypothetical protein